MTSPATPGGKLFVSYAHVDAAVVHAICGELVMRGLSIWIDQNEAGEDIVSRLNRGLKESKLFIAFAGATYFHGGRFTAAEYGAAFHKAMGADGWRMIVVRLSSQVELPPLAASRLFIDYSSPSATAEAIVHAAARAELWDGAVYREQPLGEHAVAGAPVHFADIGDRDLEFVAKAFLSERLKFLRTRNSRMRFDVSLPQQRRLAMSIIRALVENEGLKLAIEDLIEAIHVSQRFISKFSRQIDEGFLGKFEVSVKINIERQQAKLEDARSELRRELGQMAEDVQILHGVSPETHMKSATSHDGEQHRSLALGGTEQAENEFRELPRRLPQRLDVWPHYPVTLAISKNAHG